MGIDNFGGESSVDSGNKSLEILSPEESEKLAPQEFSDIFNDIFSNGTIINPNDASHGKYFTFSENGQSWRIDAINDANKRILSLRLDENDSMNKKGLSFQLIEKWWKYFSKDGDVVSAFAARVHMNKKFRTRVNEWLKEKQERDKKKTMYPGSVAYNIPDQEAADQEEAVKLLNKIEEGLV